MSILDIFKRQKKLTEMPLDELRHEEKRLEIRENQLIRKIEKIDREKERIFDLGAKTKSAARRRVYARQFNSLTQQIYIQERDLSRIIKEIMTLGRLRSVIENERTDKMTSGVLDKLDEKTVIELQVLLENDKITEEIYLQKLDSVLGVATDPSYEVDDMGDAGLEVMRTWEAMDEGELDFETGLKQAGVKESSNKSIRDELDNKRTPEAN
jgi:hypothetical protein